MATIREILSLSEEMRAKLDELDRSLKTMDDAGESLLPCMRCGKPTKLGEAVCQSCLDPKARRDCQFCGGSGIDRFEMACVCKGTDHGDDEAKAAREK